MVSSVGIIERWHVDVLFLHKPVITCHYSRDGSKEYGVATHESEECGGGGKDFPRDDDPATDDGGDDAAALDVDIAGKEDCQVICGGDGVRSNVGTDLSDVPGSSSEKGSCPPAVAAIEPFGDDIERVPDEFSIDDPSSGGSYNADNCTKSEDDREEGQLDELTLARASIS